MSRPRRRVARVSARAPRASASGVAGRVNDEHCSPEWQPLFWLLFSTGMTISEALGLRRSDIDLRTRRVSIYEEYRRNLKRESRTRELSIPAPVVALLAVHLDGVAPSPEAQVFPFAYWPARRGLESRL